MTNPLLEIQSRIPFDTIRAEHVEPAIDQLLEQARSTQRELAGSTGTRTFENTMTALEDMTETLDWAMSVVRHLEGVATCPELRAAYNAVQPRVSLYYTEILLDPGLWRVLKEFAGTPEAQGLSGTRARFLKKTMDSFKRQGADLDSAGKEQLKALDVQLTQLTTKFGEHVLDATNAFELIVSDEAQLAGLPVSAREAARESARSRGAEGWRFTLQAPSFNAVMTYLDDRSMREGVYRAFMTRATAGDLDNEPLIEQILSLRDAKGKLLGYRNFADLVLEERMARTGEKARSFIEELRARTEARFRDENAELQSFRRELEGESAPELQPWDVAYYAEKLRARLYDFDEEALRPYYPLGQVVSGMFELVHRLYGIEVVERSDMPVWDPTVQTYAIIDRDGTELGTFYADWYPRENKRGGAWMDAFITGGPRPEGIFRPHVGFICGNLTPPVGDKPALLTPRDVETIFHEFGHLLHHCLSRVDVRSLAGTAVSWDFVELPSQIMENWCWERQSLDLFARHYLTGEPIPADLFDKMDRARTFRAGNAQMRQLGLGTLDLALHVDYSAERDGRVLPYARRVSEPFAPAPLPENYGMVASFTHLFSSPVGYAAGYYSYKWAEVLEADAFTRFREAGVFSAAVGAAFRETILSRGDSEDPAELFRHFMGRDPDVSALLQRSGLIR